MRPASNVRSRRSRFSIVVVVLALAVSGVAVWRWRSGGASPPAGSNGGSLPSPGPSGSPGGGEPGPINTAFPGLTTFRGNATRDFYGSGQNHAEVHETVLVDQSWSLTDGTAAGEPERVAQT